MTFTEMPYNVDVDSSGIPPVVTSTVMPMM